jgi:hypothetical protein
MSYARPANTSPATWKVPANAEPDADSSPNTLPAKVPRVLVAAVVP